MDTVHAFSGGFRPTLAVAAALVVVGLGCGKDSSGPGSGGLDYPNLSQALVTQYCVRGNATVGDTKSGDVVASDCDAADVRPGATGYYEVYIVKVASAANVTFDVSSNLDSYLTLLRLDSYTASSASLTILDENDDRSSGNLDALLTYALEPNTNYVIAVGGYDYGATGTYSLAIR